MTLPFALRTRPRPAFVAFFVALLACLAPHSVAAQDQRAQLRSFMELYVLATFGQGADQACAILPEGELRAMQALENRLGREIESAGGKAATQAINQFAQGQSEAEDCNLSKDASELLGNARTMARALVAAPLLMQSDPAQCWTVGTLDKVSREDWQMLKQTSSAQESDPAKAVMFDNLRAGFASFIDQDCARMTKNSVLLQPAYATLRRMEDIARIGADDTTPLLTRKPGASVKINPIAQLLGPWKSQAGGFNGAARRAGLDFFRVQKAGDVETGFVHLDNSAMFGTQGRMFFTREGRWIGKIRGDIEALELRFSDGSSLPMLKTQDAGRGFDRWSTFALSSQDQDKIAQMEEHILVSFAYRKEGSQWEMFKKPASGGAEQQVSLQQLRFNLDWANAPQLEE